MKITFEFDDDESADAFIEWWLDGGGEQEANFDTVCFDLINGCFRLKRSDGKDESN